MNNEGSDQDIKHKFVVTEDSIIKKTNGILCNTLKEHSKNFQLNGTRKNKCLLSFSVSRKGLNKYVVNIKIIVVNGMASCTPGLIFKYDQSKESVIH